jgi:hypothetical protein
MDVYHTKTFQLLGTEPISSAAAIAEVERDEKRLALRLPPSVREWYSYRDSVEILEMHSNQDPPIPVGRFALTEWKSNLLLPFKFENQGVCVWSIMLDGSDDPPVYVDVDSNGTQWQLQALNFSTYVYSCVWGYKVVLGQPALVQAQNKPVSVEALTALDRLYVAEPKTYGWPGSTQYRFRGSNLAVLIWSGDGQADWFVGARNVESLESALKCVWQIDDVGESLYDCTESAKLALAEFRSGQS